MPSASNILLSDSDSDDDAFLQELGPSLSSRKRSVRKSAAQQKKADAMAILDEGVEYGEKQFREQQRYHQLKMEESSKHNLLTQAESIVAIATQTSFQQSIAAKRRQTNDAILGIASADPLVKQDGARAMGDLEHAEEEDDDEHEHDEDYYKRRKAQAHATITGRTTLLGVRKTLLLGEAEPTKSSSTTQQPNLSFSLFVNQDSNDNDPILQELQSILAQITSSRNKLWTMAIVKPIQAAMKENCLYEFLDMCVLVKHCEKHQVTNIPQSLMVWMYKVACSCSTMAYRSSTCASALTGNNKKKKSANAKTQKLSPTFQRCAFETLLSLWDNGITAEKQPILVLEEMVPQLEQWYGLQPLAVGGSDDKENQKNDYPRTDAANKDDHENDEDGASSSPTKLKQYSTYNVGLKHYMHLWSLALLKGYVVLPTTTTSGNLNVAQVATECLVALSRAGIDVTFQSGRFLLNPLRSLLYSILHMVSNYFENDVDNSASSGEKWNGWMTRTVEQILKQRYQLGSGVEGSENEDDCEAWLSMSLMVRLFPTHMNDSRGTVHTPSLEFRTMMALESLKQCLDIQEEKDKMEEEKDGKNGNDNFWDRHAKSVLKDSGNESLMKLYSETRTAARSMDGWKEIISAYVGIFSVELVGDKVATDGPRCMATVESAALCAEGGMNLVSLLKETNQRDDSQQEQQEQLEETVKTTTTPPTILATSATAAAVANGGLYQSVQNADTMCHILDLLEHQARQLMKRIKQYQIQPHFQRCMYYLSCLQTFYRYCKEEASRMAGRRESLATMMGSNSSNNVGGGGRQTSMDSFFAANGVHHSDDDDDDGDGDDKDKDEDEDNEANVP